MNEAKLKSCIFTEPILLSTENWGRGQSWLFPGHCISKLSVKLTEGSERGESRESSSGPDTCWTSEHWDSVNLGSAGAGDQGRPGKTSLYKEILHTWPELR